MSSISLQILYRFPTLIIFFLTSLGMTTQISSTISHFLKQMGYSKPIITIAPDQHSQLKEALSEDFNYFRNHPRPFEWFDKASTVAVNIALTSYSYQDFKIQLYVARSTLFVLFFDDFVTAEQPASLATFQRKLITNEADSDIIVAYRRIIMETYRIWDDIPATLIVNSLLEFTTGCALEGNDSIKSMKVRDTAATWPDYLRAKTGVSPLYAFTIFPVHSPLVSYIQVMGDVQCFIEGANDVLSFYKESLAGETGNYVSYRAVVTKRSQIEALQDVADQAVNAYNRICKTLEGQELTAWKVFAAGYLTFHTVSRDRYLLDEILPPALCGGESVL